MTTSRIQGPYTCSLILPFCRIGISSKLLIGGTKIKGRNFVDLFLIFKMFAAEYGWRVRRTDLYNEVSHVSLEVEAD